MQHKASITTRHLPLAPWDDVFACHFLSFRLGARWEDLPQVYVLQRG